MSIANFSITGLILLSLVILLLFRFIRLLTDKFINRISIKHWVKRVLFALELVVWIILIYQLAENLLNKKPVLSVIMILLLVFIFSWTFWFVLRDYLAGIYIRISGRFKLHETIAFGDPPEGEHSIKGKIIRFAHQNLILEMQNYTIIEVPYNKLFNIKIERLVQSVEKELTLLFEIRNMKERESFMREIKKRVLELPWISHKYVPKIAMQKQEDAETYLELKVILIDKKYRNRVEEILTKSFGK